MVEEKKGKEGNGGMIEDEGGWEGWGGMKLWMKENGE